MKTTVEYLDAVKARLDLPSDYAAAKALAVTRAAVSSYRTGRTVFDDLTAARVASILNLEPIEVIAAANFERSKEPVARKVWEGIWGKAVGATATASIVFAVGLLAAPASSKASTTSNGAANAPVLSYVKL